MSERKRLWLACGTGVLVFAAAALRVCPWGPVVGTGQDEWYNALRGLRVLHEGMNPAYFIHPALYYEILAAAYGLHGLTVAGGALELFVANQDALLNVARGVSLAFGALSVAAAVLLAAELSGPVAGLFAGLIVGSLPLLVFYSGAVRVDTLSLFLFLTAVLAAARRARDPGSTSLAGAAAAIGLAAAANYPGALLLVLPAVFEFGRAPGPARVVAAKRVAASIAIAGAVFLVLNPYTIIDLPDFLRWFSFQAGTAFRTHPHAGEPSLFRYLATVWDQGFFAAAAGALGVAGGFRLGGRCRALAVFATLYALAFSLMRSQYDRFILPPLVLLAVLGVVVAAGFLEDRLARGPAALRFAMTAGLAALILAGSPTLRPSYAPRGGPDNAVDYREAMFVWLRENIDASASLIAESDTLPLLLSAHDPGRLDRPLERGLREALLKAYPDAPKTVIKAQFIGGVANYDETLLSAATGVFFLGSSANRRYLKEHAADFPGPARFYEKLDRSLHPIFETSGPSERLTLYGKKPLRAGKDRLY